MKEPGIYQHFADRPGSLFFQNLYSGQIFTGSGVDLDDIAFVYEQRYINLCAGLNGSRLICASSGIALEARLGLSNCQLYEQRGLHCEYAAVMRTDLADFILFYELQSIADCILIQRDLVIGFHIHESIQIAVVVQVLHISSLDTGSRTFLSRTESLLNNTAALNIL